MDLAWKGCAWGRNEKKRPAGDVKESQHGSLHARCAAHYMGVVLACWSRATQGGSPVADGWSGMNWTAIARADRSFGDQAGKHLRARMPSTRADLVRDKGACRSWQGKGLGCP